jgi:hypothetical protein
MSSTLKGCKDEKPFHGPPPLRCKLKERRFPPLKVTGITQMQIQVVPSQGFYNSVIPVTFTRVKPG